jgi:MFS family permease
MANQDTALAKDVTPGGRVGFSHHEEDIMIDREPYGPPGLRGLISNPFVFLCAACSTLGGLVFGYDQGVVSVILVMDQFLERFPEVAPNAAGAGFWKGLMTAMIELGALLGALNQGWIADKISRRYSIVVAVIIFTIGSILQTAAVDYAMLTVARFIGGVGIGMLSMVAPLYISEISKWPGHTHSRQR